MIFRNALLLCCLSAAWSFQQPLSSPKTTTTQLYGISERVEKIYSKDNVPAENTDFDKIVKAKFPDALSNKQLETKVAKILVSKGFKASNTLLATSLCCDELARTLEDDFSSVFGKNFNLGGLGMYNKRKIPAAKKCSNEYNYYFHCFVPFHTAGFPFAGNTGFGAMSAHIPDDGNCFIVFAPHVGITKDGLVGKVEREGIALVDNCCGSAIAASNYVKGISDGSFAASTNIKTFTDFQQGAVQELILPHGKRLNDADNRMKELPYALYESQNLLLSDIVTTGAGGLKKATTVLGGVQINTSPDTLDYFHPLRFDMVDGNGKVVEDLLPLLK